MNFKKVEYHIRAGTSHDQEALKKLFKQIAENPGGLARKPDEITDDYIKTFLHKSLSKGIIFVAEDNGEIIGSIHAYSPDPIALCHVLGELTIGVHPDFQGKGIGRSLFESLLKQAKGNPSIARVELLTRASNKKAIKLYESLGFKQEGYLEKRILSIDGTLEADIPMAWHNPNFEKNN